MKKRLMLLASLFMLAGCVHISVSTEDKATVTFKDGTITSDTLYKELKDLYGAEKIMELIDKNLLTKLYETDSAESKYITQTVKAAKEQAKEMNADFNLFLSYYYGVNDENAYKNYLSLNYKREKWAKDYAKENVTEKQINDYYETEVFGDVEASQILITVDIKENATDDEKKKAENEALDKAKDIIKKLNEGEDFATLAKEHSKDASTAANGGTLGKINDGDIADEVLDELRTLKDGTYNKTPIKSSYGFHIVYKKSQEEKPKLDDALKKSITETIGNEMAQDQAFYLKSLKALREKYEVKFNDLELKKSYEDLMTKYESQYSQN